MKISRKEKSDMMIEAAHLLHNNKYYTCVIHDVYYSCYQIMCHIWFNVMKKSDNDLSEQTKKEKKGHHEFLINEINKFIKNKGNFNDKRDFYNNIIQLKKLRVEADYKTTEIDLKKSEGSFELYKKIMSILEKYY